MDSYYLESRDEINTQLKKYFRNVEERYKKHDFEVFQSLIKKIKKITLAKGKRIRPFVSLLMFEAVSARKVENYEPFVALELFHVFGLIHDDMIDEDDKRRGESTVHDSFLRDYENKNRNGNLKHIADGKAVLAGDLVYSWVQDLIFNSQKYSEYSCINAYKYFSKMVDEVLVGQVLDIDQSIKEDVDKAEITKKTKYKTASYTFIRPMQIGTVLADGSQKYLDFCEIFGEKIGVAFQLQDDLLDIVGEDKHTGKNSFGDIKEGQHTFYTNYVKEQDLGKWEQLREYKNTELSDNDKKDILQIFSSTGAIQEGRKKIGKLFEESAEILEKTDLPKKQKNSLYAIIKYLKDRNH